jgi:DNA-binding transcriptional regulator YhcF (GntR family)
MDAITKSYELIKSRLTTHVWPDGTRLPSLDELAALCDVSKTTVWKALELLKKDLLISSKKGGVIIAGPPGMKGGNTDQTDQVWKRIRAAIVQEIFTGSYQDKLLPPINKLSLRYGTAINTVKKALLQLTKEGVLERIGRKYSVVSRYSPHINNSIVFISTGDCEHGISVADFRTAAVLESFERECQRRGYYAICEAYNPAIPTGLLDLSSALKAVPNPVGYIVNIRATWNPEQWQRWLDLLRFLLKQDAPVIIMDQPGDVSLPDDIYSSKFIRLLRIAGERAGEMVAASLHREGHLHVAYITPYYKQTWAKNRYEGVCRYFKANGGAEAKVDLFALSEAANQLDWTLAALRIDTDGLRSLFNDRHSKTEIDEMVDILNRTAQEQLIDKIDQSPVAKTIEYMYASLNPRN